VQEKHGLIAIIVAGLTISPPVSGQTTSPEIDWRVYPQLTAEHFDGAGGIDFDAERVRIRTQVTQGRLMGLLQLDLAANDLGDRKPGALNNVIMDVYLQAQFESKHRIRFGQFKTPIGMDFNTAANSLDITKRGMEAGLILQRDFGAMISARNLGAFGYDFGVFNIAGRSPATTYADEQKGEDNAYVARGHFDSGPWHAELALGETTAAGGPGTADYQVIDFAAAYRSDRWSLKAEWIDGSNVRGNVNRDEDVWFAHAGHMLNENFELIARHYAGTSHLNGVSTRLSNTYLGFNWWPYRSERMTGRLQVNYVLAGGDESGYTGVRGFRSDGLLLQFQLDVSNR